MGRHLSGARPMQTTVCLGEGLSAPGGKGVTGTGPSDSGVQGT